MQTNEPATVAVTLDIGVLADALADRVIEKLRDRPATDSHPSWLDVNGLAEHLGCSPERVRKLVASNALPYHQERPGARLFFNRREVDDWLLAQ